MARDKITYSNDGVWKLDRTYCSELRGGYLSCEFDGLGDAIDYINRAPIDRSISSAFRVSNQRNSFTGTASMGEAQKLARDGWKEGRDRMQAALALAVAATAPLQTVTPRFDVAGEYPDVARFLGGDPANMVNRGRAIDRRKSNIRLLVSACTSSNVTPHQIMTRGAAILAQVDAWEANGWQVEIAVCFEDAVEYQETPRSFSPMNWYGVNGRKTFVRNPIINVKRAGDPVELDRLAFALVHHSMQRRIMFGLSEAIDTYMEVKAGFGAPVNLRACTPSPLAEIAEAGPLVYLPSVYSGTAAPFNDHEAAAGYMSAQFSRAVHPDDFEQAA